MDYINLVENTIKYIEENLEEDLTLDLLSKRCYLSKYYFHRIFTALMECSLIEYIKQRRLNQSLKYVLYSSESLIDISNRLQFGSQASFTRAFKKNYGYPPGYVRKERVELQLLPIPTVLKKALKNFNSNVVTDFTLVEEKERLLIGFYMNIDLSNKNIQKIVNRKAEQFLISIKPETEYNAFTIYFFKKTDLENKYIPAFFGIDLKIENKNKDWKTYKLPSMIYAKFKYSGDLLDIGDTVVRDLKRWMNTAKIELIQKEIFFIQAYDKSYQENGSFRLYLPIHKIPQGM